jgi:hypothetical protein
MSNVIDGPEEELALVVAPLLFGLGSEVIKRLTASWLPETPLLPSASYKSRLPRPMSGCSGLGLILQPIRRGWSWIDIAMTRARHRRHAWLLELQPSLHTLPA